MDKTRKKCEFFELLCLNDNLELRNWLISKGKSGKPIAPVMFLKQEKEESEDSKNGKN